jgi:DNA-binding NarL/FixJ family response regulator
MRSLYLLALSEDELFTRKISDAVTGISQLSMKSSSSFRAALPRIRVEKYDCIIVDKNLGSGDGITLAPIINRVNPDCLTVLIVEQSHWATIEAARSLGFSAIINMRSLEHELPLVIAEKLSRSNAKEIKSESGRRAKLERLSEREREILVDISQGKRNYEIATMRHISEGTIKSHLTSIYRKLEVRNRVEAISMMNRY